MQKEFFTIFSGISDRILLVICSVLAAIVVAVNITGQLPRHDSMYSLQVFHYVYLTLLDTGQVPYWMHNWLYGNSSSYFLETFISPFYVIITAPALALHITNTMELFKIHIVLATFFLVITVGILTREMTRSRNAMVFACLACGFSVLPLYQIHLNFMSYVFIPLMLIYVRRFFVEEDITFLIKASSIIFISAFGNATYQSVIMAIIASVFFTALLVYQPQILLQIHKTFVKIKSIIINLIILLIIALSLTVFTVDFIHDTVLLSPMRDAQGINSYQVFLTYGGDKTLKKFLELFFAIGPNNDSTIYVGIIVFGVFIYGVVMAPLGLWLPIFAIIIVIFSISMADLTVILPLLYHFPAAEYFRHAGLYLGIARCLITVFAAYSFSHFLSQASEHEMRVRQNVLATILISIVLFVIMLDLYYGGELPYPPALSSMTFPASQFHYIPIVIAFVISLLLVNKEIHPRTIAIIVLIGMIFDCASYQHFMLSDRMYTGHDIFEQRVSKAKLWDESRVRSPESSELQTLLSGPAAIYETADAVLGIKRCTPFGRWDFIASPVAELFKVRGHPLGHDLWPTSDEAVLTALGCGKPVIWVPPTVILAAGSVEANRIMQEDIDFKSTAVIATSNPQKITVTNSVTTYQFRRKKANSVDIVVANQSADTGWLVVNYPHVSDWKAFVDGNAVEIMPTNVAVMGIAVPPGEHVVKLIFAPHWFVKAAVWIGFPVIAIYLICLIGIELRRVSFISRYTPLT